MSTGYQMFSFNYFLVDIVNLFVKYQEEKKNTVKLNTGLIESLIFNFEIIYESLWTKHKKENHR